MAVLKTGFKKTSGQRFPELRAVKAVSLALVRKTLRRVQGSGWIRWLPTLALCVYEFVWADETLRCGSRIAALGQTALAVQAACGEPSMVDRWPDAPPPFGRSRGPVEIWTYNFGPNRLLWLLRLDGDRLSAMETEGYGFIIEADRRCEPPDIVAGMSKYRLLAYCGEPAAHRARDVLEAERPRALTENGLPALAPGSTYRASYREEWTYNFGSTRLTRKILIDNGRVIDVQDGERGFDIP